MGADADLGVSGGGAGACLFLAEQVRETHVQWPVVSLENVLRTIKIGSSFLFTFYNVIFFFFSCGRRLLIHRGHPRTQNVGLR